MEKKEEALQTDLMVKRRKWKNRLGAAAVAAAVLAISAGSIGSYVKTRQTASPDSMDRPDFAQNANADFDRESGGVMAAGTTAVGVKAVTFEIDFLEDTSLYVEKVYLANGDSVKAGDKYINLPKRVSQMRGKSWNLRHCARSLPTGAGSFPTGRADYRQNIPMTGHCSRRSLPNRSMTTPSLSLMRTMRSPQKRMNKRSRNIMNISGVCRTIPFMKTMRLPV